MARVIDLLHPSAHAHAGAGAVVLDRPVDVGRQPAFFTFSFSWKRTWRVLRWPLLVVGVTILLVCLPMLRGWSPRWVGTGQGSWSMAKEGGVMPFSLIYVARADSYQEGDIVSFWYLDTARPASTEESAIKRVVSVEADGTLVCRGDNQPNSDHGEYVVPRDKVRGKVVGPRLSLSTVFWRWLSMGWSLQADEIAQRGERIFSLKTITGLFSEEGRWRNGMEMSHAPSMLRWIGNRLLVTEEGRITVYRAGKQLLVLRGEPAESEDGSFAFTPPDDGGRRWSLDLATLEIRRINYGIKVTCFNNTMENVSLAGDVVAMFPAGKQFSLDGVIVHTVSASLKKGGPQGSATVVFFTPSVSNQPTMNTSIKLE